MSGSIFTRRAYQAVAGLIAHVLEELDCSGRQYLAERLCELFAADSPNFDRVRFMRAAGAGLCEPLASRRTPSDGNEV